MDYELEIIDSLAALKYQGNCLENAKLAQALIDGLHCADYRDVIIWVCSELHILRKTDERITHEIQDDNEFTMELSSMLKELGCPYSKFIARPLSERFSCRMDLMELLEYLLSELMATKMALRSKPSADALIIPKSETNTARALQSLAKDMCIEKPPHDITPKAFFNKLNFRVEESLRTVNPGVISDPLLKCNKTLTDLQWKLLETIQEGLDKEYNLRREVLLTRLEVTIHSFQWSDKMKSRSKEISERFQKKMKELELIKCGGEDTNLVALLAARADLAIIEKTSSANVRKNTTSKIQKHVIGNVPDRGGRAYEHAPPPPEMPSWQQRKAAPTGVGNRGGMQSQQFANSKPQQHYHQAHQNQHVHHRNQNWMQGSGRVQGTGWSHNNYGRYQSEANAFQGGNHHNGGNENYNRGRSNYHRGGQRR